MKVAVIFCVVLLITVTTSSEDCGKYSENDKQFPWNVGIYIEREPGKLEGVCLGSIIKPNFIITGAHCLCDRLNGQQLESQFYIALGKISKTLSLKDKNKSIIIEKIIKSNIHVFQEYSGLLGFFENDIAVVKVEKGFTFNDQVSPVCVDWGNNNPLVQGNTIGKQVVWDGTSTKIIETTHIDHNECVTECQKLMWQSFLTNDKICANSKGYSLSEEDGGSGLVFKNPENGKWYVRAVYCLQDNLAHKINVYTRIGRFLNWLTNNTLVK